MQGDAILAILSFVKETADAAVVFRGLERYVLVARDIVFNGSHGEFPVVGERWAQKIVRAAGSVGC